MGKKGKKSKQQEQPAQPSGAAGPSSQQIPQEQGGQPRQPQPQSGQQHRQPRQQGGPQGRQPQQKRGPQQPRQQVQQPSGPEGPAGDQQRSEFPGPAFQQHQAPRATSPPGFAQRPGFPGPPPASQQVRGPRGPPSLQQGIRAQSPQQPFWGPPGIQPQQPTRPQSPPQQQWRDPSQQQRDPQQQRPRAPPQQYGAPPGVISPPQQGGGPPQQKFGSPGQQQFEDQGRSKGQHRQQPKGRGRPHKQDSTPPQLSQPVAPPAAPQQEVPQQQHKGRGRPQAQQQRREVSTPGPSQQRQPSTSTPSSPSSPQSSSSSVGPGGDCLELAVLVKPGTRGRKIQIESNHLALNMGKLMSAIHYDVVITPDTPKSLLRDVMIEFGRQHYPNRHPAFDGRRNLYSPTPLPFVGGDCISGTVKVPGENKEREFKVEIKFARTVDLSPLHDLLKTRESPQDALQCLDIVLRNAPSLRCIQAGRSFFTPPRDQIIPLGEGMEMYYGFYQSAIRGWKALLNIDVSHKAFPKEMRVLDLVCELGSDFRTQMTERDLDRPLNQYVEKDVDKFLRMLKVRYEIPGQHGSKRIQRCNGLDVPASRATFKMEDGKSTTVERYFSEIKRVKLRYPHLPTVWVGARQRESKLLFPMEFCTIIGGQVTNRKMTENQTSAMIKKAATSTQVRKEKIFNSLSNVRYNDDPCMKEFGFTVNDKFEKLDARVLQPPSLLYANNAVVQPRAGVWRADRNRFLVGATIRKWTIVSATRQPARGMEKLADMVLQFTRTNGIQMDAPTPPYGHIGGRQQFQDFVNYFQSKRDFDLIFVVVPNSGTTYSLVKKAAEINVGCLTQCLKEKTLFKLNPQTVGNILLKVNSKMNGTNHSLNGPCKPPIMRRPCMIMGADVTHPSPDARDIPSVAAVTASHDPQGFKYNICWRLQPPKVEVIEDLKNITKEQLMFFYRKANCKPETIIFFRDGVSEGQFKEVRKAEIYAIQQACKSLQPDGYEPKITFLVVQKRHHTRLFPTNPRDSEDKNCNVPAGTCVDSIITNPRMQDFYLVSHASIQGVAKPTKYCTLWDDNNMSNDDVEELAYHLCHMFTRCNRSVSYPAPTYYAHLAAARAKVYIENDKLNMDDLKRHQDKYKIQQCILEEKPMFFV